LDRQAELQSEPIAPSLLAGNDGCDIAFSPLHQTPSALSLGGQSSASCRSASRSHARGRAPPVRTGARQRKAPLRVQSLAGTRDQVHRTIAGAVLRAARRSAIRTSHTCRSHAEDRNCPDWIRSACRMQSPPFTLSVIWPGTQRLGLEGAQLANHQSGCLLASNVSKMQYPRREIGGTDASAVGQASDQGLRCACAFSGRSRWTRLAERAMSWLPSVQRTAGPAGLQEVTFYRSTATAEILGKTRSDTVSCRSTAAGMGSAIGSLGEVQHDHIPAMPALNP